MKLMISQPMKGKTQEQILVEREGLISQLKSQGHEVIDTVFAEETPEGNKAVFYLSKLLKL